MGATHVNVIIRNPAEPERSWEGLFLVDTGAHNSLVPRRHLEAIGIRPLATKQYELADGTRATLDIAGAHIEFMGQFCANTVIFGRDDAEPLLGLTALEAVGAEVDPVNERLKLLPAVRLKSAA